MYCILIPLDFPRDVITFSFLAFFLVLTSVSVLLYLSSNASHSVAMVISVVAVIGYQVFSTNFGFFQLGAYDLSPMIDLAHRYEIGQSPITDFPSTFPSLFMALIRLSSAITSPSWTSILLVGLAFSLTMTLVTLRGLYLAGMRNPVLYFSAGIFMGIPWIATTHPWHSSLTSQLAAATIVYAIGVNRHRTNFRLVILGVLIGLLLVSKQNVGFAACVGLILIQLYTTRGRLVSVHYSLSSLLVAILVISEYSKTPWTYAFTSFRNIFLERQQLGLIVVSPEIRDPMHLLFLTVPWVFIPLGFFALLVLKHMTGERISNAQPHLLSYVCLLAVVWCAGSLTNWDSHWNELPTIGCACVLLLHDADLNVASYRPKLVAAFMSLVLLTVAIGEGGSRYRNRLVGPLFEEAALETVTEGFMDGIRLGPTGIAVINLAPSALNGVCQYSENVLFGPRLEFLYAQTRTESPKGLPLWWHPGSSYSVERDEKEIEKSFEKLMPLTFVTLGDDFTRLPGFILQRLQSVPPQQVKELAPLNARCIVS